MYKFNEDNRFLKTTIGRELLDKPLGFIDVGARGGIHELIYPMGNLSKIIAFEPDPDADTDEPTKKVLNQNELEPKITVEPVGLGEFDGEQKLHLTELPAASSLMEPNLTLINRYKMIPPKPTGNSVTVKIKKLDDILNKKHADFKNAGEIIKLDTQGAELSILKGATQTLKEVTVALFVEVEFLHIYKDQPLFSDVEKYLRGLGFSFYGFDSLHYRSTRRNNTNTAPKSRERLYWADAIFFKDPFDTNGSIELNTRQTYSLLLSATLLRYIDFALEIIDHMEVPNEEKAILTTIVTEFGSVDQKETVENVQDLQKIVSSSPDHANKIVGEWIENRQPFADFKGTSN